MNKSKNILYNSISMLVGGITFIVAGLIIMSTFQDVYSDFSDGKWSIARIKHELALESSDDLVTEKEKVLFAVYFNIHTTCQELIGLFKITAVPIFLAGLFLFTSGGFQLLEIRKLNKSEKAKTKTSEPK